MSPERVPERILAATPEQQKGTEEALRLARGTLEGGPKDLNH